MNFFKVHNYYEFDNAMAKLHAVLFGCRSVVDSLPPPPPLSPPSFSPQNFETRTVQWNQSRREGLEIILNRRIF